MQRASPLELYGRFGAIGPRPGRTRQVQPPPRDYRRDAPAKSTTLEWRQPRPFHGVFFQREPLTTEQPVWVEGIRANELVHPSVGMLLGSPTLSPPMGHTEAAAVVRAEALCRQPYKFRLTIGKSI